MPPRAVQHSQLSYEKKQSLHRNMGYLQFLIKKVICTPTQMCMLADWQGDSMVSLYFSMRQKKDYNFKENETKTITVHPIVSAATVSKWEYHMLKTECILKLLCWNEAMPSMLWCMYQWLRNLNSGSQSWLYLQKTARFAVGSKMHTCRFHHSLLFNKGKQLYLNHIHSENINKCEYCISVLRRMP